MNERTAARYRQLVAWGLCREVPIAIDAGLPDHQAVNPKGKTVTTHVTKRGDA